MGRRGAWLGGRWPGLAGEATPHPGTAGRVSCGPPSA